MDWCCSYWCSYGGDFSNEGVDTNVVGSSGVLISMWYGYFGFEMPIDYETNGDASSYLGVLAAISMR